MSLSLYIHLPFCHQKCFYCSFVVAIGQEHRVDDYLDCLNLEAEQYAGKKVDTVYLGGGTPSFLSAVQMEKLFKSLRRRFIVNPQAEITIECNPENLTDDRLSLFKNCGINRLSLGIQSLHDDDLKYLGRNHQAQDAIAAYERVRQHGFDNVSVDLMFSFPGQSDEKLTTDIKTMLTLKSEHVSLYALDIEERSRFHVKKVTLDHDQKRADQYEIVRQNLEAAGYPQYEVSNFSRPGFESKHNMNYWRGGNYVGLGVGAHSHVDGRRFWNVDKLNDYLKKAQAKELVVAGEENLSVKERLKERLLFGLRTNQGVSLVEIENIFNVKLDDQTRKTINELVAGRFLDLNDNQLKVTDRGRLVLEEISVRLL